MTGRAATVAVPPLAAAARVLSEYLGSRWADSPVGPPPRVATLGAVDVLSTVDPERRGATVHLTPAAILVGPWGGGPACGHCLGVRWQRLRTRTERDALETGAGLRAVGPWPELTSFALEHAWAVYQWAFSSRGAPSRVSSVELSSLAIRTVPVLADPLCPSCGASGVEEPAPVDLAACPKPSVDTYRVRSLDSYALPVDALVNPVCGVLGAGTLLNVTSPTTAPVTGSVFVRGYGGLLDVSWSGQANAFTNSRRLALLEGLERYAGTHRRRGAGPVVASYADVADRALDPTSCGVYSDETYAHDPLVTPFDPEQPIPWVWGWSLRDERPVLVPRRLCQYSSWAPYDSFVLSSSSGCATGSCLAEAVLYGLLELVERDAFLLGWYGQVPLPRIDLASCPGRLVRAMVDRAALCGYDIHAFDNRIDLGIPVVTSLAVRRDGGPGTLSFAAAAHVDPAVAVEGALAEALTYLPHLPRSTRRRRAELEAMADDFALVHQLADHSALFGLPRMATHARSYVDSVGAGSFDRRFAEWSALRPASLDLRDDLSYCLAELAGFDVFVVDQTTPEQAAVGLRTVCVVVPGLVPIDFGWARQRALHSPRLAEVLQRFGTVPRQVPHPFP